MIEVGDLVRFDAENGFWRRMTRFSKKADRLVNRKRKKEGKPPLIGNAPFQEGVFRVVRLEKPQITLTWWLKKKYTYEQYVYLDRPVSDAYLRLGIGRPEEDCRALASRLRIVKKGKSLLQA